MFNLIVARGLPAGFILPRLEFGATIGFTLKARYGPSMLYYKEVSRHTQQRLLKKRTPNIIKTVGWRDGPDWTLVVVTAGHASDTDKTIFYVLNLSGLLIKIFLLHNSAFR